MASHGTQTFYFFMFKNKLGRKPDMLTPGVLRIHDIALQ